MDQEKNIRDNVKRILDEASPPRCFRVYQFGRQDLRRAPGSEIEGSFVENRITSSSAVKPYTFMLLGSSIYLLVLAGRVAEQRASLAISMLSIACFLWAITRLLSNECGYQTVMSFLKSVLPNKTRNRS